MNTQYSFEEIILEPFELRELKDFTKEPELQYCHADILLDYGLVDAQDDSDIIDSNGNTIPSGVYTYSISEKGIRYLEYLRRRKKASLKSFILSQLIPLATLIVTLIPLFKSCSGT